MSEYFLEPKSLGKRVKVELEMSNYATKIELKNVTGFDMSKVAKKIDVANLKYNKLKNIPTNASNLQTKVHKLDVDKLVPVSVNLNKLSDIVKDDVVKKDVDNANIKNIEDKYLIFLT